MSHNAEPTHNDKTAKPVQFAEVLEGEKKIIRERRKAAGLNEHVSEQHTGLAFSGGGIRAACLAFGFAQGLARNKPSPIKGKEYTPERRSIDDSTGEYFSWFDYLSTVSGGGYAGSMLTALATKHAEGINESDPEKEVTLLKARGAALNELDPDVRSIARDEGRLPLWRIFRYRGRKIGNMPSFVSRHLISTAIFNIPIISALIILTCGTAFIWRLLDEIPITTYFWWASNHNLMEANRPFLIPIALGYIWTLIAVARPKNNRSGTVLALFAYILLPLLFFGVPFLILLTVSLLLTWLMLLFYWPDDLAADELTRESVKSRCRREALAPASLLFLMSLSLTLVIFPVSQEMSVGVWLALAFCGWLLVEVTVLVVRGRALTGIPRAIVGVGFVVAAIMASWIASTKAMIPYIPTSNGWLEFWIPALTFLVACIALSSWIGRRNRELKRESHQPLLIITCGLFFASLLAALAVWLATPNMNFASKSTPDTILDQNWMKYLWPVITAFLLPLLRPQALFQSGEKNAPPTKRWFFNLVSSALLVGIPFLLVYWFAKHDLSGHASKPGREWKKYDFDTRPC
ncbi:MAG: hypothetical protein U0796_21545 [Gemmatales bacterium]